MSGFKVLLPDHVVNTGLDSAVFATRTEAEQALATLLGAPDHRDEDADVRKTKEQPNTTFQAWNEAGW